MKELKVTLYDVFGYLVPGAVVLAALSILYWSLFSPQVPPRIVAPSVAVWVVVGVAAYLLGHIGQALANLFPSLYPSQDSVRATALAPLLLIATKAKLAKQLSVAAEELDNPTTLRICGRAAKLTDGAAGDELYGYREGFYRGLSVGFLLLGAVMIVRAAVGPPSVIIEGAQHRIELRELVFAIALSLGCGLLCAHRYRRFSRYRMEHSVVSMLFGYPRTGKAAPTKEEG